ncbi:MAG: GAF domain-containing protein [Dehalococcoidales bacterium]|nr:GAF domain-containing protein [Dehalococcoidales bacterium]
MKTLRNPHLWIIFALFTAISLLQYVEMMGIAGTTFPSYHWGLTRHSFDRLLLLIPIIYANWIFGVTAGFSVTLASLLVSLPRILFFTPFVLDSVLELVAMIAVGLTVCFLLWLIRRERDRADRVARDLDETRRILQHNLDALTISEKRLSILNTISTTLYNSLELKGVFQKAVRLVSELMSTEITLLFVADGKNEDLQLVAQDGVSDEFVEDIGRLKFGEGVYGEVARTASPIVTESAKHSTQDADTAFHRMRIQVQLIVPMVYQERVSGVICVAMRRPRQFSQYEIDLMSAVGTQIAVAIENARLYGMQRQTMDELTKSEGKYRRLFERASDAIWANDLSGRVTVANRAAVELMGDKVETMIGSDIRLFLDAEGLETARRVRRILLVGQPLQQPYEQKLIRKDKAEVILMVSTSLVKHTDEPPVFEHVARDVTKERRMQDNLRHYVQQITRTQEEERNRIARDLHDDTAQALYVLTRQVDNFLRSSTNISAETTAFLKGLGDHIRNALQGVRRFSHDLRPPMLDDLGLMATLRWLASDMEVRTQVATRLSINGTERRLAPHVELAIFRIVQEALRNVEKHAAATEVDVNIEFAPVKIGISVTDNGKGFQLAGEVGELPREGRLGLVGMEERAHLLGGHVSIHSEVNKGTRIFIDVPV